MRGSSSRARDNGADDNGENKNCPRYRQPSARERGAVAYVMYGVVAERLPTPYITCDRSSWRGDNANNLVLAIIHLRHYLVPVILLSAGAYCALAACARRRRDDNT